MGRLPAIAGGGPTAPEMAQAGKATDPKIWDGRVAEVEPRDRIAVAYRTEIRFFVLREVIDL